MNLDSYFPIWGKILTYGGDINLWGASRTLPQGTQHR